VPEAGPAGGAQERWWDGSAWTGELRPAAGASTPSAPQIADAPTQAWDGAGLSAPQPAPGYGYPQQPPAYGYPQQGYPQQGYVQPYAQQPAPRKNNTGLIVGLAIAVIAAAGIGAAVWLGMESDGPSLSAPPPAAASTSAEPSPDRSQRPSTAPSATTKAPVRPDGTVKDTRHGWSVPLPSGWTSDGHDESTTVYLATTPYSCTSEGGCVRGNFAIDAQASDGADARTVAQEAMADFAPALFGDLVSHQELASGTTTVAGLSGYAERWYVVPKEGAKGYVLVVAVPAQGGGFTLLVGSVDDHPDAPKPAVLDRIVQGIRATGNGAGV